MVLDTPKSEETRRRILDAAARLLQLGGYANTTLTKIAVDAGVKAPAIYYYFDSRNALVEQVVVLGLDRARQETETALAEAPESFGALDRISVAAETHLRMMLAQPSYLAAATQLTGQLPTSLRATQTAAEQQLLAVWERLFTEAKESGELGDDLHPVVARMIILGALNQSIIWWNPRRHKVDDFVSSALHLIRGGITTLEQ